MPTVITRSAPYNNPLSGAAYDTEVLRGYRGVSATISRPTPPVLAPWPVPSLLLKFSYNLQDFSPNRFTPNNAPVADLQTADPSPVHPVYQNIVVGANNALTFPNAPALNLGNGDWTISMFVKPIAGGQGTYPALMAKGGYLSELGSWNKYIISPGYPGWGMSFTRSMPPTGQWVGNPTQVNGAPYNVWTRVTSVKIGNTLNLYKNGTLYDTFNMTGMPDLTNTHELTVGVGRPLEPSSNFRGHLSDVVIIKGTALSVDQITALNTIPYPYP
jgi:hypothetical protein